MGRMRTGSRVREHVVERLGHSMTNDQLGEEISHLSLIPARIAK